MVNFGPRGLVVASLSNALGTLALRLISLRVNNLLTITAVIDSCVVLTLKRHLSAVPYRAHPDA